MLESNKQHDHNYNLDHLTRLRPGGPGFLLPREPGDPYGLSMFLPSFCPGDHPGPTETLVFLSPDRFLLHTCVPSTANARHSKR